MVMLSESRADQIVADKAEAICFWDWKKVSVYRPEIHITSQSVYSV